MSVFATSIKIFNEFRNESVDWLLANVGDKIRIEIDFYIETSVLSSSKKPMIFQNIDGHIGRAWIYDGAARFKDFKVGDSVEIRNYITNTPYLGNPYTIREKLSNSEIRLDNIGTLSGVPDNYTDSSTIFTIVKPITAVKYKWNFIENDDQPDFNSKVDGTEHLLVHKNKLASDLTLSPMEFIGKRDYQSGSATIQGMGIDTTTSYKSKYKIVHNTFITPFILAEQLANIQDGINPDYFFNLKCLKGIFDIEAAYDYTDPNFIQMVQITTVDGNSGWFNENFNTGLTNYFIDSVVFKRPDTTVIPAIELTTGETSVEIVVKNTADSPFVNSNTKFTLNFIKVPTAQADYQNKNRTLNENFTFDRKLQTVGSASANGDNFGTSYQVLKDVAATFISSSEIKITAKIAMDANVISIINESDEFRYLLWVAVQKHTLATSLADKVALIADSQEFYEDASDPTMIVTTHSFIRHPHSDPDSLTEPVTSVSVFPEDELAAIARFYVDKNGRSSNVIVLKSAEAIIKIKNSVTLEEFTLDSFKYDMSNLSSILGNQFVDFTLARPFHIPDSEIRRNIKLKRRIDLDGGDLYYYDFIFPLLVRWEYWVALANAAGVFFDTSEPQNGLNNFWHRYTTITNWGLYYESKIKATKDGVSQTYSTETLISSNDYDTAPDWEPDSIKAYNHATNALLYDAGTSRNFILGYETTRIEAEFTHVSGPPVLANVTVVFGIEVFEEGGVTGRRRMSSKWPTADTWFTSITGNNMIDLSLVGNIVTAKCLIDFTKIPLDKKKFKITARIYYDEIDGKLFQDGDGFLYQNGDIYQFQDQI